MEKLTESVRLLNQASVHERINATVEDTPETLSGALASRDLDSAAMPVDYEAPSAAIGA